MKRTILFTLLLLTVFLAACALTTGCDGELSLPFFSPTPVPTPTPSPTPTPVPTPVPLVGIFGAEDEPHFLAGAAALQTDDFLTQSFDGGMEALAAFQPEGRGAVILYLDEAYDDVPQIAYPLFIYAANGQTLPDGVFSLTYENEGVAAFVLDDVLRYPPHETPVRLIGLFASAEGEAYTLWKQACADGRVMEKAAFVASEAEGSVSDWLIERLASFYPGMLDAIYAETGALAAEATLTLASLGRDDVEVFGAATDGDAPDAQTAYPTLLVELVGADLFEAGKLCREVAAAWLTSGAAESKVLLPVRFPQPTAEPIR